MRPSMRPSSVHLSVALSPPKPQGGIPPNLLHIFLLWYGCARASLFFSAFVRPCVRLPSICPSRYLLLNHWAEFNQTLHHFPLMVRVWESNIIFPSVHPSVRLSVILATLATNMGICDGPRHRLCILVSYSKDQHSDTKLNLITSNINIL